MRRLIFLYVDSDNAIEAPRGDVDDAFALVALLLARAPVAAVGAVAGNTSAARALAGNRATARVCGFDAPLLAGGEAGDSAPSEAARWLAESRDELRIVALGPLTNVARALRIDPSLQDRVDEIVVVGGNLSSSGRWPPVWPWEFNLWKDRPAAREVFDSRIPLTIVPLDVAKRLRAGGGDLARLGGPVGEWLRARSRRWLRRARLLKLRDWFPVWDLAAAMLLIEPGSFRAETSPVAIDRRGRVVFGAAGREANVVTALDRAALWRRFEGIVAGR